MSTPTVRDRVEDHGEHYCGSIIIYDPVTDVHTCAGMHDDLDIVVEPGECEACLDSGYHEGAP